MTARFVPLPRCQECGSGCIRAEEERDDSVGYISTVYVCDKGHLVDEILVPERRPQGRAGLPRVEDNSAQKPSSAG